MIVFKNKIPILGRKALREVEIPPLLSDKLILQLAAKYEKTPAQILLRHLVQLGFIVIPKSVKKVNDYIFINAMCNYIICLKITIAEPNH